MIGIEVFIVTFMSIFCFMSVMNDIRINYKMSEYGICKLNLCRIGQMYRLDANPFTFSNLSIIK